MAVLAHIFRVATHARDLAASCERHGLRCFDVAWHAPRSSSSSSSTYSSSSSAFSSVGSDRAGAAAASNGTGENEGEEEEEQAEVVAAVEEYDLSHSASLQVVCWQHDEGRLAATLPPEVAAAARPLTELLAEEQDEGAIAEAEEQSFLSIGLH